MSETYTIRREELRRILVAFKVNEKSIAKLISDMEKSHRHMNIIAFASMLEKLDINRRTMSMIFRRLGMDEITVNKVFNMVDEEKMLAESGRLYDATLDLS